MHLIPIVCVSLCTSGVARGGQGATAPLAETLPPLLPPKWNYTLYRGLWRAAILNPSQPPCSPLSPPCRPLILKSLAMPLLCTQTCIPHYIHDTMLTACMTDSRVLASFFHLCLVYKFLSNFFSFNRKSSSYVNIKQQLRWNLSITNMY